MDRFFDALGDFLRSLLEGNRSSGYDSRDPDVREAMEELDEYLRTGQSRLRSGPDPRRESRQEAQPRPSESLRRDYANLEVHFGAAFEEVRAAHRRLLRRYHPDRFARDPEKQRLATEITQKINESFQRIQAQARPFR